MGNAIIVATQNVSSFTIPIFNPYDDINLKHVMPMYETLQQQGGYFVIHISSQTTKKEVSENPHLRTTTPRKLLSLCDTTTFAPVQSQVLHNS